MPKKFVPVMNRIVVERIEGSIPLFYAGQEVFIKDDKVFRKGVIEIELSIPVDQLMISNREVEGKIIALGPYANMERFGVEVIEGDIIRYSCYASGQSRLGDKKFDIINDSDIHSVVVED